MAKYARCWVPPPLAMLLALAMLAICLVACQAPDSVAAQRNTGNVVVSTAVGGSRTATPTLPSLTIGVWTSSMTPGASDTITIYVLCMMQNPARGELIGPAVGLQVRVRLANLIDQFYTATTGRDGLAQVRVSFTGAHPGQPVTVEVVTTWHGVTYRGQTVFMPGSGGAPPPTPTPAATSTPAPEPTEPMEP